MTKKSCMANSDKNNPVIMQYDLSEEEQKTQVFSLTGEN